MTTTPSIGKGQLRNNSAIVTLEPETAPRQKLNNFPGAVRSATTVKTYIGNYELYPFDGIVLAATFDHDQLTGAQPLQNWFWSEYKVDWPALATSLTDLLATKFRKFDDNYLSLKLPVTSPYRCADWMSEQIHCPIWNAGIGAQFVHASRKKLKGIFLDLEPNNSTVGQKLFKYTDRDFASTYTFEEYKAQAELIGSLMMQRMQENIDKLVLIISFSYEQAIKTHNPPESTDNYGLFASFLTGLFKGAKYPTVIHGFYEDGYNMTRQAQIDEAIDVQANPPATVLGSKRYFDFYRPGFASYVDGLSTAELGDMVLRGLEQVSEEKSWIYEQAEPFLGATGAGTATAADIAALENVRIEMGWQREFDPAIIPGLIMDFNPAELTTYADTDPISSYTDSTGLIFTQSGSNRPTYKVNGIATGYHGVDFASASSQSFAFDAFCARLVGASDIPITVIGVFKLKTAGASYGLMGLGKTGGAAAPAFDFKQASTNYLRFGLIDDATASATLTGSTGNQTSTAAHIGAWITSGLSGNLRCDGANTLATNPYGTMDLTATTFTRARMGSTGLDPQTLYANVIMGRWIAFSGPVGLDAVRWCEKNMVLGTSIVLSGT